MKRIMIPVLIAAALFVLASCGVNHLVFGQPVSKSASYSNASIGDIIQFGGANWRVLEIQDGKMLIISEDILEHGKYDGSYGVWETSDIRTYLNGEFLARHFSKDESALILETLLTNDDNPEYGASGGGDTYDKLFLLSFDEAEKYFADDADRVAYGGGGTVYCGAAYWWWLRSSGRYENEAAIILDDGSVNLIGIHVRVGYGGFRPSLWLEIKNTIHEEV